MGDAAWHPGLGPTWKATYMNNEALGFGTDLANWPGLNDYGDTVGQDITFDTRADPVIQGTAGIPGACLPYGANGKDPDGCYLIEKIHHRGNLKYGCPTKPLAGKHDFSQGLTEIDLKNVWNGLSAGDGWVGATYFTYAGVSGDGLTLTGVVARTNPHKPWEADDTAVMQPGKLKLRHYKISNPTPDPAVWVNNVNNAGYIDALTDCGIIFDIQHFHSYCGGGGAQIAVQMGSWHNSFVRNFYIESSLKDCSKGGGHSTGVRWWHGTFRNHIGAGSGGRHSDGCQWWDLDNTSLKGQPTLYKCYFYGNTNNGHFFTNPAGIGDRYVAGVVLDTVLFGGFTDKGAVTTVVGSHGANPTVINVASTAAFPPNLPGEIFIAGESIDYTGKTATSFTGCSSGDPYGPYGGGEEVTEHNPPAGKFLHTGSSMGHVLRDCWIYGGTVTDHEEAYNVPDVNLAGKNYNLLMHRVRYDQLGTPSEIGPDAQVESFQALSPRIG